MRSPDAKKVAYENDNDRIDIYANLDDQAQVVPNHTFLIEITLIKKCKQTGRKRI